jgi:TM2 domain-containing membrane protein YozV
MQDSEQAAMSSSEETPGRTVFCPDCGASMAAEARFCGSCRWDAENPERHAERNLPSSPRELGPPSDKNRLTTLLLCIFGGFLGLHRFYVGRIGSGVLWFVTFGLFSVGWIYDLVMVATGEFVDERERRVLYWD